MQVSFWQKVRYGLLLLLVVLIALSSHPSVTSVSIAMGIVNGTFLSPYILVVFAALFVLSIRSVYVFRLQKRLWLLFVFILLSYVCVYLIFRTSAMVADIRSIGICLCAIAIGCQLDFRESGYRFMLFVFAGLMTTIGLILVMTGIGGFEILDQSTVNTSKNSFGVALATAILCYLSIVMDKNSKQLFKIVSLFLLVLSFVVLLTIRARAASLAAVFIVVYYVFVTFKNNYKKSFVFRLLGIIIVVGLLILVLPDSVGQYVYDSFFQNHEDDITSGRTERNLAAIQFLSHNILVGNVEGFSQISWIHNFPLLILYDFGLFFSFPILLLYIYLLVYIIKNSLKEKVTIWSFGVFALLIPFIISMAEPTFPFGPGTATVFSFIVFGVSLRHLVLSKEETKINQNTSLSQ